MASAAAFLLCDFVWVDSISNNHTLLGVFTRLRASKFPTPFREISAFALLVGEPGEFGELALVCCVEDTGQVVYETGSRLAIGPEGKTQVHIGLGKFSFPQEGRYRF